jgi:hypothetical protein
LELKGRQNRCHEQSINVPASYKEEKKKEKNEDLQRFTSSQVRSREKDQREAAMEECGSRDIYVIVTCIIPITTHGRRFCERRRGLPLTNIFPLSPFSDDDQGFNSYRRAFQPRIKHDLGHDLINYLFGEPRLKLTAITRLLLVVAKYRIQPTVTKQTDRESPTGGEAGRCDVMRCDAMGITIYSAFYFCILFCMDNASSHRRYCLD